jgi:hypothetical protein
MRSPRLSACTSTIRLAAQSGAGTHPKSGRCPADQGSEVASRKALRTHVQHTKVQVALLAGWSHRMTEDLICTKRRHRSTAVPAWVHARMRPPQSRTDSHRSKARRSTTSTRSSSAAWRPRPASRAPLLSNMKRSPVRPSLQSFTITSHARERWQERVDPDLALHEAHEGLAEFVANGRTRPRPRHWTDVEPEPGLAFMYWWARPDVVALVRDDAVVTVIGRLRQGPDGLRDLRFGRSATESHDNELLHPPD